MKYSRRSRLTAIKEAAQDTAKVACLATVFLGVCATGYIEANFSGNPAKKMRLATDIVEYFEHLDKTEITPKSDVHVVMPWQDALLAMGYDVGRCNASGVFGKDTTNAFVKYAYDLQLINTVIDMTMEQIFVLVQKDIVKRIKEDKELQTKLDDIILKPFRTPDVQAFMQDLHSRFSITADKSILVRTDITATAILEMFRRDRHGQENRGRAIYGGCANNKQVDAFRHASFLIDITLPLPYSATSAGALLNLRERRGDNAAEIMLTDIFNHGQTVKLLYDVKTLSRDPEEIVVNGIQQGVYALRPFPLVSKKASMPAQ